MMKIGNKYNWKNQPERLIFTGKLGYWNQFVKLDEQNVVWCEVLDADLHMLEESVEDKP